MKNILKIEHDETRGDAKVIDEADKKNVKIVTIDPSKIIDSAGNPIDLTSAARLREWLIQKYDGIDIEVADNGHIVSLKKNELRASVKRRGKEQREIYADLDSLIENSIYFGYEPGDSRHTWIDRQNIYYAAARIGDDVYGIRFKADVKKGQHGSVYKDHRIVKIENIQKVETKWPPSPCRGFSPRGIKGGKTEMPASDIRSALGHSIDKISHSNKKVNSKNKKV